MHLKTKIALLVVMVMAFMPAAGNAYACDGSHSGVAGAEHTLMRHHGGRLLGATAAYLGLTREQLRAKLAGGRSLAQIADATPGKSAAGLVDDLLGLAKTKLDRWVAAGKLDATQESAILDLLRAKLEKLVTFTFTRR